MSFASKISGKIRYLICLPLIMIFGFITMPLTLLFKWDGFWILYIANEQGCSLKKAKNLLNGDERYKVTFDARIGSNYSKTGSSEFKDLSPASNHQTPDISSSTSEFHRQQTSPSYSNLGYNIFHVS